MGNGLKLAVALSSALALSGPTMGCDSHEDTESKKLGESTEKLDESTKELGKSVAEIMNQTNYFSNEALRLLKENRELRKKLLRCNRDFVDSNARSVRAISDLVQDKSNDAK